MYWKYLWLPVSSADLIRSIFSSYMRSWGCPSKGMLFFSCFYLISDLLLSSCWKNQILISGKAFFFRYTVEVGQSLFKEGMGSGFTKQMVLNMSNHHLQAVGSWQVSWEANKGDTEKSSKTQGYKMYTTKFVFSLTFIISRWRVSVHG